MPDANGNNNNSKKKILGILVLILALCVIGGVVFYMHYRTYHVLTDDAFIDGNIYNVTPLIPGKVAEVLISDNQYVEKDQVLVKLDTVDIEASLHTAKQNLEVVKNQIAGQYASINVVNAQVKQLEAQMELINTERERLTNLLAKGAVSQDDYDKNQAQWKALHAQIGATRKQKKQIKSAIGPKDTEGKEAAIRLAEANIAQIQLQLDHAVIRAPIAGYVTRKNVNVGQVVAAGQPLMAIVSLEGLFITANYKETVLTLVKPGQPVEFKVDSYPGVTFHGKVASIMAGTGSVFSLLPPQNATGNYIKVVQRIPVKIDISGLDIKKYPLRVGMSVVPTILVKGS